MSSIAEFSHPRLVAVYDTVNPYHPDAQPGFYRRLAAEVRAASIVDLGCGTGVITRQLAGGGYRMIGVDPSPAMLRIAQSGVNGDRVRWIEGGATDIGSPGADLAIMTGHVAQFFVTEASWREALLALHGALRPGGRLAFESRNPAAREWDAWNRDHSRIVEDPSAGVIELWSEVHEVASGVVSSANHYLFMTTGQELVSELSLRFRSSRELVDSLAEANFTVERAFGDWDRPATRRHDTGDHRRRGPNRVMRPLTLW